MTAATFQWLTLVTLTVLTFSVAETGLSGGTILIPVLLVTLVKGRLIIDRFMALQGVSGPWRWVVLGWLLLVLGLIAYTFQYS